MIAFSSNMWFQRSSDPSQDFDQLILQKISHSNVNIFQSYDLQKRETFKAIVSVIADNGSREMQIVNDPYFPAFIEISNPQLFAWQYGQS